MVARVLVSLQRAKHEACIHVSLINCVARRGQLNRGTMVLKGFFQSALSGERGSQLDVMTCRALFLETFSLKKLRT